MNATEGTTGRAATPDEVGVGTASPAPRPQTMRAIVQTATAPATPRVEEIDRPEIEADEVLRPSARGGPRPWHVALHDRPPVPDAHHGLRPPRTEEPRARSGRRRHGRGGRRRVTRFAVGDEVFGVSRGAFAEYAAAREDKLARKPSNLTFEQAAAVPVSATTAIQGLRAGRIEAGQKVLIIGASGGVGTYAVQLAKAFGAEVTGVCSTAKTDLVRSLGADHVIDYTEEDFTDGSSRYDLILDIGGNTRLSRLRRALTPTGTLVIVGGENKGNWTGGFGRSLRAPLLSLFVRQRLDHARVQGALRRPRAADRAHRGRKDHAQHRQDLPARPGPGRHASPRSRKRPREAGHHGGRPRAESPRAQARLGRAASNGGSLDRLCPCKDIGGPTTAA